MTRKELEALGFTVKENGRIDFAKPPKGKLFVPVPTDEDDIRDSQISRDFITYHKFSATTMQVKMMVVDESEAEKAKAYVAAIKSKCKKDERKKRCRITSPKTGKKIMCPECISCYSDECPKKKGQKVYEESDVVSLDFMSEKEMYQAFPEDPAYGSVEAEMDKEIFRKKLKKDNPKLARVLQMLEEGRTRDDILEAFQKRKDQTSWFYSQTKSIEKLWQEFSK